MILRILAILLGLALLAIVYALGVRSLTDPNYVLWFGLASAIAAPIGLGLIAYAVKKRDKEILAQLAKVPEIEKLTKEATSKEESIKLLEEQRVHLVEVIRLEARKQALASRKDLLENDAQRILDEIRAVQDEAAQLNVEIKESAVVDELKELEERIQARKQGDVIFKLGSKYFVLDRSFFNILPYPINSFVWSALRRLAARKSSVERDKDT